MKRIALGFAAVLLASVPAFAAIDNSPSADEHKAAAHGSKAEMAMNAREAKTTAELNQQAAQDAAPSSSMPSSSMTPAPSAAMSTDNAAPAGAAPMSPGASQPAN
jgi:hypothetical protein